ncbi:hypothetical protein JS528_00515 [Bifidobacterium sp. MA2]|uniref:Uncharacterized protein n=1 Tax=Bifidobacterium santillanense TaxID=2809028 RepID=A0ABS5ULT3_9BIFI|nr:hypothetical protein [Bifidobacterium santillanense]MBT1171864.1 hypothetical protein [Bifidobacterium santillanense]
MQLSEMSKDQLVAIMQPLDRRYARLAELEDDIAAGEEILKAADKARSRSVGWSCVAIFMAVYALVVAFADETDFPMSVKIVLLVAGVLIGGLSLLSAHAQYAKYAGYVDGVIPKALEAMNEDRKLIAETNKSIRPVSLLFPNSCRNAEANAYMLELLLCGRATDFNTAITLWESHAHMMRMENFERMKVEEARKQTTALRISAAAQVGQAFEAHRQTNELRGLRDDLQHMRQ